MNPCHASSPVLLAVSTITTICGSAGAPGASVGPALNGALTNGPTGGVVVDPNGSGDIYYADKNQIFVLRAGQVSGGGVCLLDVRAIISLESRAWTEGMLIYPSCHPPLRRFLSLLERSRQATAMAPQPLQASAARVFLI